MPPGDNLEPEEDVRITEESVQFGFTQSEIEAVWARIEELLADVDRGEIHVF